MHVKRVAGALGAEVKAVNLGEGFDTELAQTLRALLNEHEVLFLRDQSITPAVSHGVAGNDHSRGRWRHFICQHDRGL